MTAESKGSFQFVPFAQQPTYPSWEERRANPRIHRILLLADFTDLPPSQYEGIPCESCHVPYRVETSDFEQGWGNIEKLRCIITNMPQLVCDCKLFNKFEDPVKQRVEPAFAIIRKIEDAIYFERDKDFRELDSLLSSEDVEKVKDFVFNRWVPEGSGTAIMRAKRHKEL